MNSFEAFVQASSSDDQTKPAILLAVTQSIFSFQETGYVADGKESDSLKVMEIVKTLSAKNDLN